MRGWIGTSLVLLLATVSPPAMWVAAAGEISRPLEVRLLGPAARIPDTDQVISGALDAFFEPLPGTGLKGRRGVYWLKIPLFADALAAAVVPVLVVRSARQTQVELFASGAALRLETTLPAFRGARDRVYALPPDLTRASKPMAPKPVASASARRP